MILPTQSKIDDILLASCYSMQKRSYILTLVYMPGCISHPWQVSAYGLGDRTWPFFPLVTHHFLKPHYYPILHCYYQESGPIHVLLRVQGDWGTLEYGGSLTGHRSSFVFRTPYCRPNILGIDIIIQLTTEYIQYRIYRVVLLVLWWIGEDGDHLSAHIPFGSSQCSCKESRLYHDLNSNWQ